MTIQEAIKILESSLDNLDPWNEGEIGFAAKLGIEALKRLRYGRNHPSGWELEPLPGETEE